jgi:hypothetical protein
MYDTLLVVIDEVTEAERDEYLRLFSRLPTLAGEATRWLRQWMRAAKMKDPNIEELPGFEELFKKSIKKALQTMPLEERLAGLAPEERLAGLAPEQVLLGLPLELLRGLHEDYLRSLPVELQEKLRRRLRGEAH